VCISINNINREKKSLEEIFLKKRETKTLCYLRVKDIM